MLVDLEIHNFKPFGTPQHASFAPLTLIYGPNSGGKSSLIQSLLLLRQSFGEQLLPEHPLLPRGDFVDLGSFRSLLHRHELTRSLEISLSYSMQGLGSPRRSAPVYEGRLILPKAKRHVGTRFRAASAGHGKQAVDRPELTDLYYRLSDDGESSLLDIHLKKASPPDALMAVLPRERHLNYYEWSDVASTKSYAEFILSRAELRNEFDGLWGSGALIRALARITGTQIRGNKARYPSLSTLTEALDLFSFIGRGTLPAILYPKITAVQDRQKSSDPCCKRALCVPGTGILRSRSAASSYQPPVQERYGPSKD